MRTMTFACHFALPLPLPLPLTWVFSPSPFSPSLSSPGGFDGPSVASTTPGRQTVVAFLRRVFFAGSMVAVYDAAMY